MESPNGRIEGKTNGMSAIRFLYIEDWFGNMWQFRDGDNIKKWQHYYCNKRSSYADKVYDGDYFKVGYEAAQANGYVKEFGYDPEWPEIESAPMQLAHQAHTSLTTTIRPKAVSWSSLVLS